MSFDYQLKYYDSLDVKPVSWLWFPYIPYGKVTIVQGDPGEGKTTLMLEIAALLSRGRRIPTGEKGQAPCNVIFQGTEDGQADTIKPRLIKADADCSRIAFIDAADDSGLSLGDSRFRSAIQRTSARLLVIDPLQGFLHTGSETNKAGSLRNMFTRLAGIAEETGCAIVLIGHMNKNNNGKGIYRGLGSIDITAAARSVLLVSRDPADSNIRVILPIKTNLAPEGRGYSFIMDPEAGFKWGEECGYTSEDLLKQTSSNEPKIERAKDSLRLLLQNTELPSNEVFERLKVIGISKRTVESARKELPINVYRKENRWYWRFEE